MRTFAFRFSPAYRILAAPFGVRPATARLELDDDHLDVRFGRWRVRTPLANIAGCCRTGPYGLLKTAGPAHLSFADRGLTFATNGDEGLCIRFVEPVPGLEPFGVLRHPALTVTVADVDALEESLGRLAQARA